MHDTHIKAIHSVYDIFLTSRERERERDVWKNVEEVSWSTDWTVCGEGRGESRHLKSNRSLSLSPAVVTLDMHTANYTTTLDSGHACLSTPSMLLMIKSYIK